MINYTADTILNKKLIDMEKAKIKRSKTLKRIFLLFTTLLILISSLVPDLTMILRSFKGEL